MKSNSGSNRNQRNIRPAAAAVPPDIPPRRLGVDLHNQIGFKSHKYDVRSSSFESSGKVLPWTGELLSKYTITIFHSICKVLAIIHTSLQTCKRCYNTKQWSNNSHDKTCHADEMDS
ncbi:Hypothetical protein CINCED_3A000423 [Cinara cedri]|uniref:Uncharacterized protein n=1 Tax=Cinara cedri TaxID=506608 RepID=A0A5E4MWS6_9HEMI|nr:Hypothetical protein CINCED_3A000423 [Cinara cedri]